LATKIILVRKEEKANQQWLAFLHLG